MLHGIEPNKTMNQTYVIVILLATAILLFWITKKVRKHNQICMALRDRFVHQARQFRHAPLGKPSFCESQDVYFFKTELGYDEALQEFIRILHSIGVVALEKCLTKKNETALFGKYQHSVFYFVFDTKDSDPYGDHKKQIIVSIF